jgi:hypothetical protein
MAKAYRYTLPNGYYVGAPIEDHGYLPSNATYTAPEVIPGYIPRWNGSAWEQVENHKDLEGYIDGQPYTIKEYGPLPAGWSDTPPPPTPEELAAQRKAEILARLAAIDTDSIRPLRSLAEGAATDYDTDKLADLEAEAAGLRAELAALMAQFAEGKA